MTKKIDKPAKRGPGRPPKRGEAATMRIPFRVTEAEHEAAVALAAARGVDVSTMIRAWLAIGAPMPPDASPRPEATPEEYAAPSVADAPSTPHRTRAHNVKPSKASSATTRRTNKPVKGRR